MKDFHREVCDALRNRKCVLALLPRDHGKTTLAISYSAWHLWKNAQVRIRIASHTLEYARDIFRGVLGLLESQRFKELCGDLKPRNPDKWTQNKLIIAGKKDQKDPSLSVVSVGSATIGPHEDVLICDDIVTEDNSASQAQRNALKTWFYKELLSSLDPQGQLIVLGTRWYPDDLYDELLRHEHFRPPIVKAAIGINNGVLWPERWPLERLLSRKAMIGSLAFASQFQNDPTPREGAQLKAEWLHYWSEGADDPAKKLKKISPRDEMTIIQGWDLAIGQKQANDYTVCVTLGVDRDNLVYVLDCFRGRLDFPSQAKAVEAQAQAWKPYRIAIEATGYQVALEQYLRAKGLAVVPVKQSRDKESRILGLSPFFENGTIRILPTQQELIEEYLRFPKGEHDDILDALEIAFRQVQTGGHFAVITRKDWWTSY